MSDSAVVDARPAAEPEEPASAGPKPLNLAVSVLLAVAGGLALAASFPSWNWWPLAPVAVAALAVATRGHRARTAALVGWLFGMACFVPHLHWSGIYVGAVPWLGLATVESLYLAAMAAAMPRAWRVRLGRFATAPVVVALAGLWVAQEAVRGRWPFGGFPWGRLAFAQVDAPAAGLAALGGAPLVTAATAAGGAGLALLVVLPGVRRRLGAAVLAAAVLLVGLVVPRPTGGEPARVAAVQGNVPEAGLEFNAERRAVLDNHAAETEKLAVRIADGRSPRPQVVLWPENSSDIDPLRNPDAAGVIDGAARAVGVPVLVGAVLQEPVDHVSNTAILWSPTAGPGARYVKQHPAPFAEYIPYKSFFRNFSDKVDLVRVPFTAGNRTGLFRVGDITLGDVICFEVAYDGLVQDPVRKGANLLVVQTNNATFGFSDESVQQLAMSRLRAIETGRSVVHISTVGISGIIRPDGTVMRRSGHFTPEVLEADVPLRTAQTLATRVGAWPEWVTTGLAVLLVAFAGRRRRDRSAESAGRSAGRSAGGDDSMTTVGRVLVIVPTYNELENLPLITARLRTAVPAADLLVADDASPDGTGALADELALDDAQVHVLHRAGKQGLGAAYLEAFRWGLDRGYDVLVEMDADGSHAPEQLPDLLARIDAGADLALGSRWVPGGTVVNWPRSREVLSRGGSSFVHLALGIRVKDATGGYRAFRSNALEKLDLDQVASQGYCFQVDLLWRAIKKGLRVDEVPITFVEREHGLSKMSRSIVLEAFWRVTRWGIRYRADQAAGLVRRGRGSDPSAH